MRPKTKSKNEQRALKPTALGTESQEPGAPTRHLEESGQAPTDLEEIARQQGASQRGYTGDAPAEPIPPGFDPEHPGGRPEGDPRR